MNLEQITLTKSQLLAQDLSDEINRISREFPEMSSELHKLLSIAELSLSNPVFLISTYIFLNTPINKTTSSRIQNPRKRSSEQDFSDWQRELENIYKKRYETEILTVQNEANSLRSYLFETSLENLFQDDNLNNLAFIFYDFHKKNLIYTKGSLMYLPLNPESMTQDISFKELMRFVTRKDRYDLFKSIRQLKRLENYPVQTSSTPQQNLILNSYPITFSSRPIGVGIFMKDINTTDEYDRLLGLKIGKLLVSLNRNFETNFGYTLVHEKYTPS